MNVTSGVGQKTLRWRQMQFLSFGSICSISPLRIVLHLVHKNCAPFLKYRLFQRFIAVRCEVTATCTSNMVFCLSNQHICLWSFYLYQTLKSLLSITWHSLFHDVEKVDSNAKLWWEMGVQCCCIMDKLLWDCDHYFCRAALLQYKYIWSAFSQTGVIRA